MADNGHSVTQPEIARPPDAPAERAWLREHDVLGSDGDFAVKMVRRWVEIKSF